MYRFRVLILAVAIVTGAALAAAPGALAAAQTRTATPGNVDISQRHLNESEEAIAVNPTNPDNIVTVTNVGHGEAGLTAGMFEGVSFDGGKTWATKLIGRGAGDPLGDACCDPSLSFDQYGNLFLTYLYEAEDQVPVALSTDGGLTFQVIANISQASLPGKKAGGDNRGLFRDVTAHHHRGPRRYGWYSARAAVAATGLGAGPDRVGAFRRWVVPGTAAAPTATSPSAVGQVMQAWPLTESGRGRKIFVNTGPDGLGPAGSGTDLRHPDPSAVHFIPRNRTRSVDAEPAWPGTATGPHAGRVYWSTQEHLNERSTGVYVRHSDDNRATWNAPVQVNGDHSAQPSSCPRSPGPATGNIAVVCYVSRNDLGTGGQGDANGIERDAQFGERSAPTAARLHRSIQISAGTSNSHFGKQDRLRRLPGCRSTAGPPTPPGRTTPTTPEQPRRRPATGHHTAAVRAVKPEAADLLPLRGRAPSPEPAFPRARSLRSKCRCCPSWPGSLLAARALGTPDGRR
jgi:hypothetical protein